MKSKNEETYTSTGFKLIYHPDAIKKLIKESKGTPISLSIAPTSRCNLNCSFCSNANREKHEELPFSSVVNLLESLTNFGLKTIEWTGGGDPTMYRHIKESITTAHLFGLEQGFITNGILLKRMPRQQLDMLKWIRVSANCLDYIPEVEVPKMTAVLGFSYVMNDNTTEDVLKNLHEHVKKYNPRYVRIVPNCQASFEQQEKNNEVLSQTVTKWGSPYFYQAKHFSQPERCWWGYFKPFVNFNGDVFRCSSVVLNSDSDKTFHKIFRWCDISELPSFYEKEVEEHNPIHCDHCVFRSQNDLVDSLLCYTGMENFV